VTGAGRTAGPPALGWGADLAVVGDGLAALCTALFLKRSAPDAAVVVLAPSGGEMPGATGAITAEPVWRTFSLAANRVLAARSWRLYGEPQDWLGDRVDAVSLGRRTPGWIHLVGWGHAVMIRSLDRLARAEGVVHALHAPAEAGRLFPGFSPGGPVGLLAHAPDDGTIETARVGAAVRAALRALGVEVRVAHGLRVVPAGGRLQVAADSGRLHAQRVVIAAVGDTPALLRASGIDLPLARARWTRYVARPARRLARDLPGIVWPSGVRLCPLGDGGLVLSGPARGRPPGLPVPPSPQGFVREVLAEVARDLPGLWPPEPPRAISTDIDLNVWDGAPLVGAVREAPGLYVLAGLGGAEAMHAPAAAERLAALVVGGTAVSRDPVLAALRPDRVHKGVRHVEPLSA